jgi:hypothetical protein
MTHYRRLLLLKHKKNKTHKKITKKKPRQGRELTFKLPLYLFTFGSCFYPYVPNVFPGIFFFSIFFKKCRERKELSFKFPLYPFIFGSYFCPPTYALLFQTLSPGIFFFSSRRKEKKQRKKTIEKKKMQRKEGAFL